ncbi:PREDICTED: zinc finger protein 36, C3H1 type-like 1 [Charadrius vociferus]|uniref:zinc finger protein 36, C3H1 type-like 1 n=1 Tax=Charadrius vociferus TaxID=50402 RepID=UPI0005212B2B|nr:PREDICTED: zinc finger protein 36, C3H1 type-like 1 [Charadrius vociferus]
MHKAAWAGGGVGGGAAGPGLSALPPRSPPLSLAARPADGEEPGRKPGWERLSSEIVISHSFSFSCFPSTAASGLLDSPTSITPPPMLSADDLLGSPTLPDCASNPFTFSSQELVSLFAPSMGVQVPSGSSPTTFLFRPMSESPNMFDSPPSPQDSLSDQEGYLSSSSSSHSGSDSPILDTSRRLPIFSRLSISDD